ncbi:MAG: ubiquinone/menaquinone biosynthesis methyltransferase [Dehalococcoidia bacterium]|nr:ubiquinone/menaquinone biosynthesis methyltransferase [Dehalococcoidia bacterium]
MAHLRGEEKSAYVRSMFQRIAPRYDLLNTVISGGMHHRWRRRAAALAIERKPRGDGRDQTRALDVATGTGDFVLALLKRGAPHVVGVDFVPSMLGLADAKARRRRRRDRVTLVAGDALRLPFADAAFQWVTSGFNMRNVADLPLALAEMARVASPGGRVVILEIVPMTEGGVLPRIFRWYFRTVTPLLGQLLAGDREAYAYLPASVARFPDVEKLATMMEAAGLSDVRHQRVGFGSAAILWGDKPG